MEKIPTNEDLPYFETLLFESRAKAEQERSMPQHQAEETKGSSTCGHVRRSTALLGSVDTNNISEVLRKGKTDKPRSVPKQYPEEEEKVAIREGVLHSFEEAKAELRRM